MSIPEKDRRDSLMDDAWRPEEKAIAAAAENPTEFPQPGRGASSDFVPLPEETREVDGENETQ